MKCQAYEEYKDSGVEWLGMLPQSWECIRLKYVAELEGDKIEPYSQHKYVGMENVESGNGKYLTKMDTTPEGLSTSFLEGDVLFGKLRPYLAKSLLASFSGICSSEFLVLRSRMVNPKFLNYYTLTEEFINQVDSSTYGSKMPRASWDFISLMGVPVPKYEDSQKIANFLDHETAKIDTLIEKQQQLIKLLKEKRQAVISHAVTKGLNPNAPMRDSGVEWLSEVPEHWEKLSRIKYISSLKGRQGWQGLKADEYIDEGPYVVSSAHFTNHQIQWDICPHVSSARYERDSNIQLAEGDLLLMKDGAAMGKLAYVDKLPDKTCLNSHLLLFRPVKGSEQLAYNPRFMYYFMQTDFFQEHIRIYGTGVTFLGISQQAIGNYRLVFPSLVEQKKITAFLESETSKLDDLEVKQHQMMYLLQERRTALISAAVTGKIDVRNWVTPESPCSRDISASLHSTSPNKENKVATL